MILPPGVFLTPAECAAVAPVLMAGRDRLRHLGLDVDPSVARVTEDVLRLARGWQERQRPPAVTGVDVGAGGRAPSSVVVPLPPPGRVVTVEMAASRTGLSSRQVRRLAASGHLGGRKVGTAWLLDEGKVDRLVRIRAAGRAGAPTRRDQRGAGQVGH